MYACMYVCMYIYDEASCVGVSLTCILFTTA